MRSRRRRKKERKKEIAYAIDYTSTGIEGPNDKMKDSTDDDVINRNSNIFNKIQRF
jgi:hypothetical protein